MPKQQKLAVQWLDDATEDDYGAAAHYLHLLENPKNVATVITALRSAHVIEYKAADLLRAAQLMVPKSDDRPTREQVKRIKNGEPISPVLLARADALKKVIIADGFHRVSAAFRLDPDVILHCKLVGF